MNFFKALLVAVAIAIVMWAILIGLIAWIMLP
jgi:hypothetical protein